MFNIRVYGICINDSKLLLVRENRAKMEMLKFPGGGLEHGEGVIDCLKRECLEEFGQNVTIVKHYYTTDYFQPSHFDNRQVISIYYKIEIEYVNGVRSEENELAFQWREISEVSPEEMTFPIDKKVLKKLQNELV